MAKMRRLAILLAAAAVALVCAPATALAAGVEITQQPESVDVSYPDGAFFHVEVNNPDMVVSYQWMCSDGSKPFVLDGMTATTDTLEIPSTSQNENDLYYYCIIEDNQGHTITSNIAVLHCTNAHENIPVLYIGEYALQPGDKLDLEDTMMGEGTVEYDANGLDMTFTGVYYSNQYVVCDSTMAPSMGIMFEIRDDYELEYRFHFIGDNVFRDIYFDPDYNSAGVVINSFFACGDDPNAPTVIFDGGGTLYVIGGTRQINSDANMEFNIDVKTVPNGSVFCDGIYGNSIYINEGVEIQLGVNGTGIHADGDLWLEPGSKLDIISFGPHVSVGPTTKNVFFVRGNINMKGTEVNIRAIGDAAQYHVYGSALAVWYGIYLTGDGSLNMDDSSMSISVESMRGIDLFGVNFGGIQGEGPNCSVVLENNSTLNIVVNAPDVLMADGIYVSGIVSVDATSRLDVSAVSNGETFGIVAERALKVDDGELVVRVSTTNEAAKSYGVICGDADINITDDGQVSITAENGMAIGADTGKHYADGEIVPAGWDPEYKSEKFKLSGKATVVLPAESGIATWGVGNSGGTEVVETFFDKSDTSVPASEVMITNGSKPGSAGSGLFAGGINGGNGGTTWPLYLVGALAVLGAIVGGASLIGRKKADKDKAE